MNTYPVHAIAKLLKISDRRVQQLTKDGWIKKRARGEYDLVEAVHGYIDFMQSLLPANAEKKGPADLKARLVELQVEREELALARDKGEVAPVEVFERTMISVFAKVRAKMRMLPPRVALLLVGQADESAIRAILAREVDDALRDLGTADLRDDDEAG